MPPNRFRNSHWISGRSPRPWALNRRRFLQTSAAALSGLALSNCAGNLSNVNSSPQASPTTAANTPASGAASKELNIFSWANYTNDELLQGFEKKTGAKVVVDVFDSNEAMLAKVQAGGGSTYSIIYPSDYMVAQMVELGLLTPLDQSRLQGVDQLKANWQNPTYDPQNAHSVPVVWGTTGLIYDPQRVNGEVQGWDYLWDNVADLNRQVTLINDVREVMGATLKFLGHSLNSTNPDEIKAAYDRLVELKPAIAAFMTNGWENQIADGDLTFAMAYSTDAIALIKEKPDLQYIVPATGASLWTDTVVIPKTAPNVEMAYAWINYLLEPETAAMLVETQGVATPNQKAFDQLSAEAKSDTNLFPSDDILKRCEGVASVPTEISDLYDRYWTQLTS
jgi:spermidine/putrescine transport system substrate-binding protein